MYASVNERRLIRCSRVDLARTLCCCSTFHVAHQTAPCVRCHRVRHPPSPPSTSSGGWDHRGSVERDRRVHPGVRSREMGNCTRFPSVRCSGVPWNIRQPRCDRRMHTTIGATEQPVATHALARPSTRSPGCTPRSHLDAVVSVLAPHTPWSALPRSSARRDASCTEVSKPDLRYDLLHRASIRPWQSAPRISWPTSSSSVLRTRQTAASRSSRRRVSTSESLRILATSESRHPIVSAIFDRSLSRFRLGIGILIAPKRPRLPFAFERRSIRWRGSRLFDDGFGCRSVSPAPSSGSRPSAHDHARQAAVVRRIGCARLLVRRLLVRRLLDRFITSCRDAVALQRHRRDHVRPCVHSVEQRRATRHQSMIVSLLARLRVHHRDAEVCLPLQQICIATHEPQRQLAERAACITQAVAGGS